MPLKKDSLPVQVLAGIILCLFVFMRAVTRGSVPFGTYVMLSALMGTIGGFMHWMLLELKRGKSGYVLTWLLIGGATGSVAAVLESFDEQRTRASPILILVFSLVIAVALGLQDYKSSVRHSDQ